MDDTDPVSDVNPPNEEDPVPTDQTGATIYEVKVGGLGGGFGGYFEGGYLSLTDIITGKEYEYHYFSFGGSFGWGLSGQGEVGLAYGSSNPTDWTGWSNAIIWEGVGPVPVGTGGQICYGGGNWMYSTGSHIGIIGASGGLIATYIWYVGEK